MIAGPSCAPEVDVAEEHWAKVAGYKMRYLRAGSGPSILLIHGLMAYSFSWRLTIPALTSMRTVYAPDQLGTGFSEHPADVEYSIVAAGQRLWEFLDGLGVEKTDIVGSSLGGGIAVRMAASAPQRVNKLVLAAPVNPWSRHGRLIVRVLATRPGGRAFLGMLPLVRATGDFWLKRLFGDPRRIAPGTLDGYAAPLEKASAWQYGLSIMRNWRSDMRQLEKDYYSLADQRALLIWGDRDPAVYCSSSVEILKRMKNSRIEVLKGVGHIPYDEAPDDFNRVLTNFLEQ